MRFVGLPRVCSRAPRKKLNSTPILRTLHHVNANTPQHTRLLLRVRGGVRMPPHPLTCFPLSFLVDIFYYVEDLLGRMPRISVCLRETLSRCSIHTHCSQPGHCFVRKPKADKLGRKAKDAAHLLLCYAKRSHMFLQSSRERSALCAKCR